MFCSKTSTSLTSVAKVVSMRLSRWTAHCSKSASSCKWKVLLCHAMSNSTDVYAWYFDSDSSRMVLHSDDYFAPVAFLVIEKCHLEDKVPASPSKLSSRLTVSNAPELELSADDATKSTTVAAALAKTSPEARAFLPKYGQFRNLFHLSGIMSSHSESLTLEEEIKELFDHVKGMDPSR